jgi:bifunctional DNA primase/polymerase-like protein
MNEHNPASDLAQELRSAALAYAIIGWPVFPLVPGGKVPLYHSPHRAGSAARAACAGRWSAAGCGRDGHGVLDASLDPDVINTWWDRAPHANIGVACGLTTVSVPGLDPIREGPDVVDIDVKHGAPGLASLERLRQAGLVCDPIAVAETASGGGHLFFDGSTQGNGSLRGHGVDFRSAGGYVVVSPSVVASEDGPRRAYRWVRWNLGGTSCVNWQAIRHHLIPPPVRPIVTSVERAAGAAARGVAGLPGWLAGQGSGNRNNALHWAWCAALEGGASPQLLTDLELTAYAIGLDATEVRKTIDSATRRVLATGVRRAAGTVR